LPAHDQNPSSRTKISSQAHKIKSQAKTAVDAESEFASNPPGHFVKTARPDPGDGWNLNQCDFQPPGTASAVPGCRPRG
jgi:hypothetical protein